MEQTTTTILCGDAREKLKELPDKSVQMCVTSPPYFALRCYGGGQLEIGIEQTPAEYIHNLVDVFREVKRVLKDDGTLWLNIGDSYCGSKTGSEGNNKSTLEGGKSNQREAGKRPNKKPWNGIKQKDLIGIPWMLAFALREDGWYLRQDIIWDKSGNCFPESVKDRCTKSHEYLFLLSKNPVYYYDSDAIKEPVKEVSIKRAQYGWHGKGDDGNGNYAGLGQMDKMERMVPLNGRNKRDVWHINTQSYGGEHFATFPEELVKPCILAGSRTGDTVLDPFNGAGTTGVVCVKLGRNYIGTELNPEYVALAEKRIEGTRIELEYGIKISGKKNDTDDEHGGSLFDEAEFVAVS